MSGFNWPQYSCSGCIDRLKTRNFSNEILFRTAFDLAMATIIDVTDPVL